MTMKKNVFTVDLGQIKLTEAQRKEIDNAIHMAVTSVLVNVPGFNNVVLLPLNKFSKGPHTQGKFLLKVDHIKFKAATPGEMIGTDINLKNGPRG